MSLKTFKVKDRKDPDKTVDIVRYVIEPKETPTAVIFGKFSPWTGPNGHDKLLEFAKKRFKKVIIVSPTRSKKDPKVDIFTDEQKADIIRKANNDIEFHRIDSDIPIRMFTRIIDLGYERPVLIVGTDREKEFSKFFKEYQKNNKSIEDTTDKDFGKGEFLVVPRSDKGTSATKVREALKNNDKDEFLKLTGYKDEMWDFMKKMLVKSEGFSYFYYGDD
jgi:phosphopantetheine adenylyltransferase